MEQPVVTPTGSPAPAYPPVPSPAAAEKPTVGSYFLGLLGALLGALVGVIPWFIVSTFFSFFVGWLGFVVGLASFFGYKLFKGARSAPFAMVSVIVLSVVAICLAEFAGSVCVYWQAWAEIAEEQGVVLSAGELFQLSAGTVFEALTDPEYTGEMVGNLVIGLVIAVLGIVAVRRHIFAYANEGRPLYPAAEGYVPASNPYAPAAEASTLPVQSPAGGIPVPTSGIAQPVMPDAGAAGAGGVSAASVPAAPAPADTAAGSGIPAVPSIPSVPAVSAVPATPAGSPAGVPPEGTKED